MGVEGTLLQSSSPTTSLLARLNVLAADIKISHSIFAMPWAILSMTLAAHRSPMGLRVGQVVLILVCMVTARTVAMVANRLLDAEVDARNPRTARRAIPSGQLSRSFMWLSLLLSAVMFIAAAFSFWFGYQNKWPAILSVPVLLFVSAYPFLKRFTRFCHYYLGASLGLAPICAWIAIKGTVDLPPFLMAAAVLLWTAGFDIIYACQDYAFDVEHDLFSVPSKLGIASALWVARITHLFCLAFIISLGYFTPELHGVFWVGVAIGILLLTIEHTIVKPNDLSKVNLAFFTINGIIGVVIGSLGVINILWDHF